jgi:hypothetical protein
MLAALPLILFGIQLATAQAAAPQPQALETVNFCDVIRHPDQYNGKTVKVVATYASGLEGAILFDDACGTSSKHGGETTANAKFTGNDRETVQAFKTLAKFLKKNRIGIAQVTMIAVFTELPSVVIAGPGSHYSLNVRQLLDVQKLNPRTSRTPTT